MMKLLVVNQPNVAFEWVITLLRVQEAPGSNLVRRPIALSFLLFFFSPSNWGCLCCRGENMDGRGRR